MSARFGSMLRQLHVVDHQPYSLSIGCGHFPEYEYLIDIFPTWMHIGLDLDLPSLQRAPHTSPRIFADGQWLPFAIKFSLLVIRHPNIARNRTGWERIFTGAPSAMRKNGLLLVTGYDLDEIEFARAAIPLPQTPLDEAQLAPPDLAGNDRFALLFRRD